MQFLPYTVVIRITGPPDFLPLDPLVNKSCNIERCGNKMHQLVENMMLSQYLEFKLSLLWWTTTVGATIFERLEFFHVNKSCKTEYGGNKMIQIIQNMTLSWGLELKLSLLWRTTILGQHPLF